MSLKRSGLMKKSDIHKRVSRNRLLCSVPTRSRLQNLNAYCNELYWLALTQGTLSLTLSLVLEPLVQSPTKCVVAG